MLFALLFTAIALIALAGVCWPLLSGAGVTPERAQYDRAVYRDQLRELERDVARGILSGAEADNARLEIQRRLLSADAKAPARTLRLGRNTTLAVVVAVLMAGGATALYLLLGAPALPDAPFDVRPSPHPSPTARAGSEHLDIRAAATKLEEKLRADPKNSEGWALYARTESMLGDWQKAADAYHRAIDLGLKTPDVLSGLGEMLVLSMDGIVSPAAHDAFAGALAGDPKNDVARYYLALADAQAGEVKRAIAAWQQLAADIPDDSPMRDEISRRVAEAAKEGGIDAPQLPKGTPPQPQEAAAASDREASAAQLPEGERKEMIRGMVAQLAARLQNEPNDVDGWLRLGRSYAVLGETEKAENAYEHATKLKPGDVDVRLQAVAMLIGGLKPDDPLPPRAVALLREVQTIAPDQPEALWYLGIVAAREGHPEVARDDWTKLLKTLPAGGDDAKLVQSALDELNGK